MVISYHNFILYWRFNNILKMRILTDINHPAHVHLFKNFIWEMQKKGHEFQITARNKECTLDLLKAYNLDHTPRRGYKGVIGKTLGMIKIDWKLLKISRKFKPDILVGGVGNCYIAQLSKILQKPSIIFDDTEHTTYQNLLTFPFANTVCSPSCFTRDLGKKHVKYSGYHELAYLHPNYFKPNPQVLQELGLRENEKFFILRTVSWDVVDEIGEKGLDLDTKNKMIKILEKHGKVFISSEDPLPVELEKYKLFTAPEKIHHLLYYASMLICDSGTVSSEAAILGTPVVFISSTTCGYLEELRNKYGLIHYFNGLGNSQEKALEKVKELLKNQNLKKEARKKREQILKDKIDVTEWMITFIENYPKSFKKS